MIAFENTTDRRLQLLAGFPTARGLLKNYYQARRDAYLKRNPSLEEAFDKLFDPIIAHAAPETFIAAGKVRDDSAAGKDDPIRQDRANIKAFISNLKNAVEISLELAPVTMSVLGGENDNFTTIKAVNITYRQNSGTRRKSGNGTRIEAVSHFHELYLMLSQNNPAGVFSRVVSGSPPFDDYKRIIAEYFSSFLKYGRFTSTRNIPDFAKAIEPLTKYLYSIIDEINADTYLNEKDRVVNEIVALYGLAKVKPPQLFEHIRVTD